jgi:hypothetical protein
MKKTVAVTVAIFAIIATNFTHAAVPSLDGKNGATFSLTGRPAFNAGNLTVDNSVGNWTSSNQTRTSIDARAFDSVAGQWGNLVHADNMHVTGGLPLGMGENVAPLTTPFATGGSFVSQNGLGTAINISSSHIVEGNGYANWNRTFQLNANSSVTFSGIASLTFDGANVLPAAGSFNAEASKSQREGSYGAISFRNDNNQVGLTIRADLESNPYLNNSNNSLALASTYSYSTDPKGLISLTVSNNTGNALRGQFSVNSWVSVTSPVPEPATYLSMLLGLGIVGGIARRKKTNNTI